MSPMSDTAALGHDHVYLGDAHDRNMRRTLWVVALTAVMMVGEIVAGSLYGSMALLADGFHMATHAGALGIAAGAYLYAKRQATNRKFSFGTGKVGDLAGFASALILGLVSLGIAAESFGRLIDPREVAFDQATVVAIIGLLVNLVSAALLGGDHHHHGHDHHHDGHHHHNHDNNLRSAYFHVLADALTSVLAIAALLSGRFLGWVWLDPVMGIVGALVIARWSWSLLKDTAGVLLDRTDPHLEEHIREAVAGDVAITDLHVWRIAPGAHAAIVSVTGTEDPAPLREKVSSLSGVAHLTVEVR